MDLKQTKFPPPCFRPLCRFWASNKTRPMVMCHKQRQWELCGTFHFCTDQTRPLCLTVRHPSWGRSMWGYRSRSPVSRWCGRSPLDQCFRRHAQCETVCQQVTATGPTARESARRGLRSSTRCFLYMITCRSAFLSRNFTLVNTSLSTSNQPTNQPTNYMHKSPFSKANCSLAIHDCVNVRPSFFCTLS